MKGSDEHAGGIGGRDEIWLEGNAEEDLLVDVNDSSIFYNDFPPLPDFPCMSSSSSSSSTTAPPQAKPLAASSSPSSSSSSASWAVLKSDAEETQPVVAPPLLVSLPVAEDSIDCMDVMETFGYMELIDSNEIWDPSSIFQPEENPPNEEDESLLHHQHQHQNQQYHHHHRNDSNNDYLLPNEVVVQAPAPAPAVDELGMVFFEWLKSNKEYISAEDMRSIKLRRATVESASKRLGSTKEGKKQLLKLILEWVANCQLQKKQAAASATTSSQLPFQDPFQNPNPNCPPIPSPDNNINPCFLPSTWLPPQPQYIADPTVGFRYAGDLYAGGGGGGGPANYQTEFQRPLETAQTWPPSAAAQIQFNQFPETNNNNANVIPNQQGFVGYGGNPNPYPYPYQQNEYGGNYQGSNNNVNSNNGEKLVRLGYLATKEARKKRMARQKRFLSHHRHHQQKNHQHHNHNLNNNQQGQLQMMGQKVDHHNQQVISIGGSEGSGGSGQVNPGANWVYWPNANAALGQGGGYSSVPVVVAAEAPRLPPQVVVDRSPVLQGQNSQQRQVGSICPH